MEEAADTAIGGTSAKRAIAKICTAAFKIFDPFIIERMSIVLPREKFRRDERWLIM
jgi:hypothetical protein